MDLKTLWQEIYPLVNLHRRVAISKGLRQMELMDGAAVK